MDEKLNNKSGKIIVVTSASGGCGKTVVASNLAAAIAQKGKEVVILDNNFYFSDLHIFFDKKYEHNITDIQNRIEDVDEKSVLLYTTQFNMKNLAVLPGPSSPEEGDKIEEAKFLKVIRNLSKSVDYLVIDMTNGFLDLNLSILDMCHHLIVVSNSELSGIIRTKKYLNVLDKLRLDIGHSVVINNYYKKSLSIKQIETLINHDVIFIPKQKRLISKSINVGIPAVILNKNATISKRIKTLAKSIV